MCFGSRRDEDEYKKSRDIDAQIHRDEKDMQKVVKLLLLGTSPHPRSRITGHLCAFANHHIFHYTGAGESGKSTILKQMKLIYTKEGISRNEKEEWRIIIFNNLLDGLKMVIDAMEELGIDFKYDNTTVSHIMLFFPRTDRHSSGTDADNSRSTCP